MNVHEVERVPVQAEASKEFPVLRELLVQVPRGSK